MKNNSTIFRICCLAFVLLLTTKSLTAQDAPKPEVDHSYKPLTLKLSEDGKNMCASLCGTNSG